MSESRETHYVIVHENERGETGDEWPEAAVRQTYSTLDMLRGDRPADAAFADEYQRPDGAKVKLSSNSSRHVRLELRGEDKARRVYTAEGEEGQLTVTDHAAEGEPTEVEGDFVMQHYELARVLFDRQLQIGREAEANDALHNREDLGTIPE